MTETLGYLCRWGLLALCVLVLAASVGGALVSIERSVLHRRDAPIAADALMSQGRWQSARLTYPSPAGRPGEVAYLAWIEGIDGLRPTFRWESYDLLPLHPVEPARRRLRFVGSPYGPMAYSRHALLVHVADPARPLAVADAEALASAVGSDPEPVRRALAALRASTDLVAGFFGRREDYPGARAALRRADPSLPVLAALSEDQTPSERLLRHLRSLTQRVAGLEVELYTDRPELAESARAKGLSVSSLADRVASTTASGGQSSPESASEGRNR